MEVIANGYPAVAHPVGRATVGTPPTVLFQGLLRYPPNIDAARWLAGEIGPALRALVPDVEIRLVGDHPPELDDLDDPPRVTVTGRVPDMAAELARADVVVVPVRYGSGTRLKILEAFAQQVPVVSTTARGRGARRGGRRPPAVGRHSRGTRRCLRPPAARRPAAPGVGLAGPLALPRALPERRSSNRRWPISPAGWPGDRDRPA